MPCGKCAKVRSFIPSVAIRRRLEQVEARIEAKKRAAGRIEISYNVAAPVPPSGGPETTHDSTRVNQVGSVSGRSG